MAGIEDVFDFSKKEREGYDTFKAFDPEEFASEIEFDSIDDRILEQIDESDLPRPANFIEFCTGKKFLNTSVFPRQIQIASQFFCDMCPDCSDPRVMTNMYDQSLDELYDRVVFLRNGECPVCHKNRNDFFKEGKFSYPDSLYVCCGQRSGKSILGGGLIPHYHTARLITMRDEHGKPVIPYKYFNNPPAPFYGTFTAVSLGQALENLWKPFKGYLDSPWWKMYLEILNYYSNKLGVELYRNNQTSLSFNHKKLAWMCEPPSKKKLRGKTRFFFGIDEISWHDLGTKDDSILGSAKEVMAAGRNSLLTFRNKALEKLSSGNFDVPLGIECYCSSPAESNDILMRKVREAKNNPKMLAFRYATWEFNPAFHGPEDIGEPDQMVLMRDFGANPPLADKPFYSDAQNIMTMVGQKGQMLNWKVSEFKNEFGETTLYPEVLGFNYTNGSPKILSIDNGQVTNCFSATLLHLENGKVVTDSVVSVRPDPAHKINLGKCFEDFTMKLARDRQANIVAVAYDQWNSATAIDTLNNSGIKGIKYSLKYQDFMDIRQNLSTRMYTFVKPSQDPTILTSSVGDYDYVNMSYVDPCFGLLYMILTVRDLGKTIAKPSWGDDDCWRAWALGAHLLLDEEYTQLFSAANKAVMQSTRAFGSLGMMRGSRPAATQPTSPIGGIAHRRR